MINKTKKFTMKKLFLLAIVAISVFACKKDDDTTSSSVVLKNHSVTPAFATKKAGFENLQLFSLIGSDDVLTASPSFIFGGSSDGAGLVKNLDGSFSLLVNHEDNFAVSRITLDKTFAPTKGEYILNSDGGTWRLCSATLATPEEHGFGPIYLTSGESGEESRTHGVNPSDLSSPSISKELPGLGRCSAENAMPLPKGAYSGKTAIIIGDDDSGVNGGQVFMYLSNTVGDLQNGSFYMLKRKDDNQREKDMEERKDYAVEFVKVDNHTSLTGAQINAAVDGLKAIKFGRVEDLDYRKGGGSNDREIYFNVTGQNNTGNNADFSRTKYGRVYKLNLDANNPLTGTISCILDGDNKAGKAGLFQNPDNICVTNNYAYIQEDANSYGDETHDAYIYQFDLKTETLKVVLELDHRRTAADAAQYNVGGASKFGSWEYGALIDVSDKLGKENSFLLCIQPHTWTGDKYKAVDGGTKRPNENQASQVILIQGLPK